jgi:hypothetical protein
MKNLTPPPDPHLLRGSAPQTPRSLTHLRHLPGGHSETQPAAASISKLTGPAQRDNLPLTRHRSLRLRA